MKHVTFRNGNELYAQICDGIDFYNEKTGYFVAQYSEAGAVIVYKIARSLARKCAEFARTNNDTWLGNLGPGGQIITGDYVEEFLDGLITKDSCANWLEAGPYTDICVLKG